MRYRFVEKAILGGIILALAGEAIHLGEDRKQPHVPEPAYDANPVPIRSNYVFASATIGSSRIFPRPFEDILNQDNSWYL